VTSTFVFGAKTHRKNDPQLKKNAKKKIFFLPRVTNSDIQSTLKEFRSDAGNLFGNNGFWIDVKEVDINDFHWIDGSSLAGHCSV